MESAIIILGSIIAYNEIYVHVMDYVNSGYKKLSQTMEAASEFRAYYEMYATTGMPEGNNM